MEAIGQSGHVHFDGHRVAIARVGMSRLTIGKGTKTIPVASIAAVQWKPAGRLFNGFIAFTVPGGIEARSQFGRQTHDAARDENAVVFTRVQEPAFTELRNAVEHAITQRHAGGHVAAAGSVADEIAKLAALLERGLLTTQEFQAQKARLLG